MNINNSINRYRLFLCLFISTIAVTTVKAQVNYVLNPSFEQYWRCPYDVDQIKFANYWSPIDTINHPPVDSFGDKSCTPEYCNTCAGTNLYGGVPLNQLFYHYPRIGNGMAQVMMFLDATNPLVLYNRDYLQGRLFAPLTAGESYCVTFFVASEQQSHYACNHLGAYLDNGIIDTTQNCGQPQTTHVPQVQTLDIVYDTLNWVKIEGSFISNGTEQFITIGNFYDETHTSYSDENPQGILTHWAVYLVDDVSVVESELPAYAGGFQYKGKYDSVFVGRNEIVPDCEWYRNGVLIDTVHAGFWVKDTVTTTYVVKQSICGNVLYDTAVIQVAPVGIGSVSNEHSFKIFPNPAQKEITIQTVNDRSTANLSIFDMSGKMMLNQDVHFTNGKLQLPIDLAGGVYMVQLVDEQGRKNIQRLSVL